MQVDLNGDRSMEVIIATLDGRLKVCRGNSSTLSCALLVTCTTPQVLKPQQAGRAGEGFAAAAVVADVSLRPPGPGLPATGALHVHVVVLGKLGTQSVHQARCSAGHRAVAMAAGSLDPLPANPVKTPPKQAGALTSLRTCRLCTHRQTGSSG